MLDETNFLYLKRKASDFTAFAEYTRYFCENFWIASDILHPAPPEFASSADVNRLYLYS